MFHIILFLGTPEIIVIALVVIIFFGSKRIPELMKGLGKGMREFKNATGEIQHEIRKGANMMEEGVEQQKKKEENKE